MPKYNLHNLGRAATQSTLLERIFITLFKYTFADSISFLHIFLSYYNIAFLGAEAACISLSLSHNYTSIYTYV